MKSFPASSDALSKTAALNVSWIGNVNDEASRVLARAGLIAAKETRMGPQEKAVRVQLGFIALALDVLLTKRLDYSGSADPFLNFEDYYFPEDSRAKNAWKRLGDKLRRIVNTIRRGGLEGESVFTNDIPDSVNYLTGIIGPLLLAESDDPAMTEYLIAQADNIEAIIKNLKERAHDIDNLLP